MTTLTDHISDRPGWTCRICRMPWPCAQAKADLLAEYQTCPSALRIYLALHLVDAFQDLTPTGAAPPPDLYVRFHT